MALVKSAPKRVPHSIPPVLLNTHYYDGKLIETKKEISPYLETINGLTPEIKSYILFFLRIKLTTRPSFLAAARNYDAIVNDRVSRGANYDSTNDLHAHDMLCVCYLVLTNYTDQVSIDYFIDLLNEQLIDISNGGCPQGRVDRILQIIVSFLPI